MNKIILWYIAITTIFAIAALLAFIGAHKEAPREWTGMGGVSCDTDSMGLSINCGDTLELKSIGRYTELVPGRIYVYEWSENGDDFTVVHRLVFCPNNCSKTAIFKGDNNLVAEEVPRKNVKWEVTGISYG